MCLAVGVVIGIIVVFSTENYHLILSSKNKILYTYINGTAPLGSLFWGQLTKFLIPMVLIFVCCLNFYSGIISFIFITYQSALSVLTSSALISLYGFSGVLNVIFVLIPINLIYFAILGYFVTVNFKRCVCSKKYRYFAYGLGKEFFISVFSCLIAAVLLSILSSFVLPLFIKNAIYNIF